MTSFGRSRQLGEVSGSWTGFQGQQVKGSRRQHPRTYISEVMLDRPMAFWPLTEDAGSSAVDLLDTYTGTYAGSSMAGGRSWGAVKVPDFQGTTSYQVTTSGATALSSFAGASGLWSYSCWYYDDGAAGTRVLLTACGASAFEMFFYRSSSNTLVIDAPISSGASSVANIAVTAPSANTWHHLVVTFDRAAAVMVVYVDGVVVGTDTTMSGNMSYTGSTWRIGGRGDSAGDRWLGSIAYAAMFPTVLPPERVASHYAAMGRQPGHTL